MLPADIDADPERAVLAYRKRENRPPRRRDFVKNVIPHKIRSLTWQCAAGLRSPVMRGSAVSDLVFVLLTVALFAVLGLVVKGAERL